MAPSAYRPGDDPRQRPGGAGGAGVVVEGDRVAVWLWGEHDLATVELLTRALGAALDVGGVDVAVDLRHVSFMDASTMGSLLGCRLALRARGRDLSVRMPPRLARRMLDLCDLVGLIEVVTAPVPPSRDAASALATWVEVPTTARLFDSAAPAPAPTRQDDQRRETLASYAADLDAIQ